MSFDVNRVIIHGVDGFETHQPIPVNDRSREIPRGTHQRVVIDGVKSLDYPYDEIIGIHTRAYITVEGGDIRYRTDNINATSAIGHLVKDGGFIELKSIEEIKGFRIINITNNPIIQVSYKEVVA